MASAAKRAAIVEAQAARWLEQRRFRAWSPDDQAAFDVWISESSAHEIAYWRLEAVWSRTERLVALRSVEKLDTPSTKSTRWGLMRMAAALLTVAAAVGAGLVHFSSPRVAVFTTAIGGHKTLSLPDDSKIELNTDTVLRLASGDARKAWLDKGEAYFQIKHDKTRPFVVIVAGHRVTDLGTKFSIRRDVQEIEVALTEGSAKLESVGVSERQQMVTLKPGDVAIATTDSLSVTKKSKHALDSQLGWRHGVLIFNSTTLADAAAQFNRYNQRKLIVVGTASRLKVDGTFAATDTAAFAAISEHILHLKTDEIGGEIVISR
jgi:transmembrane sensor